MATGTSLAIRSDSSVVQRWTDGHAALRREFPLGVDSLLRHSFRHEPPRPIELEHAIERTEDAVMPLAAQFAGDSELRLCGLGAVLMARALDAVGMAQTTLTLQELETLFNRLVVVCEGRPASQEALPSDARFIAAMLLLREFMHHLHFASVQLDTSGQPQ